VHRHLVAVEVRVERGADQRGDLDRLALHPLRLDRLEGPRGQGGRGGTPRRRVGGARLSSTGCSVMTSPSTSQPTGRARSTIRLADLMFCAWLRSTRRFITNGLNSARAICLGRPHWCSLSCGPTTITDRPE